MAKKFLSIVILIAYGFIMGSCDSDDLRVEECKLDMNLFDGKYTVDDEGCCVLKGAKPISDDEVKSQVVGYGWKSIATFEVQSNGKLNMADYHDDLIGGAPIHYWFKSSQQMVQYYYDDAMPADGFSRVSWTYDATKGYILCGDGTSAMADRYQQILKLDESNGKALMYTIKKLGVKGDGKGGYEPFYGMIVYRRMTDDELKKTQEAYTYDFDKKGTSPEKTKFYIRAYDAENGNDGEDHSGFKTNDDEK